VLTALPARAELCFHLSKPFADSPAAAEEQRADMKRSCEPIANSFIVFVNPKLQALTRPMLLAVLIGSLSVIVFAAYTAFLLGQCEKQSYTTTTRSEMVQWFQEQDSFDPMNNFQKNWKCLYYTAKLGVSDGDLVPEVASSRSFHNDYESNCKLTGECEHRYTYTPTPGHLRYKKCDIGTVRYSTETPSEFRQWLWGLDYNGGPELEQKLKKMLYDEDGSDPVEDGAEPESTEGTEEFVWIAAHDVRHIPGGFNEVMQILADINIQNHFEDENKVSQDHPLWLFLQSKPYKKSDGRVMESENIHKFEQNGGTQIQLNDKEVAVILQDPRVRLRSEGGGQFPGYCGEKEDYGNRNDQAKQKEIWYGTDRRRSAIGIPGQAKCHYGPSNRANLSHNVLGFEFKLKNKITIRRASNDYETMEKLGRARLQYIKDNRHLKRSMFCNPADYDEMIAYRAEPGQFSCTADKPDDPECILVRKCDVSSRTTDGGLTPGFTDWISDSEPAFQPEYGSFLAVYQVCPKLLDTVGIAMGFIGQIEMFITVVIMSIFLFCGCVKVQGETGTSSFRHHLSNSVAVAVEEDVQVPSSQQNKSGASSIDNFTGAGIGGPANESA